MSGGLKIIRIGSAAVLVLVCALKSGLAATHYVSLQSANPQAPYTNWGTAARSIQEAVDAAGDGDVILVSNGVYNTGGRVFYGSLTNRLVINKAVTVRSVNGPDVTVIEGAGPLGASAVRCVYVGSNAVLCGFTLTNGHTYISGDWVTEQRGGGAWCEDSGVLSNCVLAGNAGEYVGGVYNGTLYDCVVIGNSAHFDGGGVGGGTLYDCTLSGNSAHGYGGGAAGGTLHNCTLSSNSAGFGGGAADATLYDCVLSSNSANQGGGVYASLLYGCTLSGNSASYEGGGAFWATLYGCRLVGNSAQGDGGGAAGGTLYNCALSDNTAESGGGGAYDAELHNCTLCNNVAGDVGGGTESATLYNCILWCNTAPQDANWSGGTLMYCCTTPLPPGNGNMEQDPQLADMGHISAWSPCRGAGNTNYTSGTDLDGESWLDLPSIGCDEYYAGSATGSLAVGVTASQTNVMRGFIVDFMGNIEGHAAWNRWDFGSGDGPSNALCASHAWSAAGEYDVVFRVYNDSFPGGVAATVRVSVVEQTVHYVDIYSASPLSPYVSWATAATSIQEAVDAAGDGDVILVSNGVYNTGGRVVYGSLTNRLVIDKAVTVRSVNGPDATVIEGTGPWGEAAVRCVYVGSNALLCGFTLTNGYTSVRGDWIKEQRGGGAWCEDSGLLSNCVLSGNWAVEGGGAYNAELYNCTLIGNSGRGYAGGVEGGTLHNCTLIGNSAGSGGGACSATLYDCMLSSNSALSGGGGAYGCTLYDCVLSNNSGCQGGGAYGSTLHDCTLIGNSASDEGGGALWATLYDCVLSGNSADEGGGAYYAKLYNCTLIGNSADESGGGALWSTLHGCMLTGNSARDYGGGAASSTVYNCTLVGNSAGDCGGGVLCGTQYNCIVWYNTATNSGDDIYNAVVHYTCSPDVTNGVDGCITNEPHFEDLAATNLHLRSDSPCIDAGMVVSEGRDLDGVQRPLDGDADGTPAYDMGCYEYVNVSADSDGDGMPDGWERNNGLAPTNSADAVEDPDGDGLGNLEEYLADTVPTNPASCFCIKSMNNTGSWVVTFCCTNSRVYGLEYAEGLVTGGWSGVVGQTNVSGAASGEMTLRDTNAPAGTRFYRVWVGRP